MKRPLVPLALGFAAGALVGDGLPPSVPPSLLSLAVLLLGLALAPRLPARLALASLVAAATATGAAATAIERLAYEAAPLRGLLPHGGAAIGPLHLEGQLAADPEASAERVRLVLDVEGVTVAGRYQRLAGRARVSVWGDAPRLELAEGDRVGLWATLSAPRGFATPGAFDLEAYAFREGLHAVGSCKTWLLVERLAPGPRRPVRAALVSARQRARRALRRWLPAGPQEALARALVLGDRSGLERADGEAFRRAGTYHVLAISGAHVGLLAWLVVGPLRRLGLAPLPLALAVCSALAAYAAFVGGEPPVTRAALMVGVLLVGRALDLDGDGLNLLALAALLLLALRPAVAGDGGFQLSFLATAGLVAHAPALAAALPKLPLRLERALAASLAAQATLAPLLASLFHRLLPLGVLLNLAAVPLAMSVLVSGGALALADAWSPAFAPALGRLTAGLAWALRHAAGLPDWPALDPRVPDPPLWAVLACGLGLLAALEPARRRRGLALYVAGWLGLGLGRAPVAGDGRLYLSVLDVGQGDALVLRSPLGRVWVVDAGLGRADSVDLGEAVVAPYLWWLGVRHVERLVLTHAHADHVGGAPFLVRALRVNEVWEGPAPRDDGVHRALDEALARRVARRTVRAGVGLDWDGVRVDVLGPPARGRPPRRARNDDSVVLRVRLGRVALLLAGDVEAGAEAALEPGPCLVLKVPHHGGRTSSGAALLDATAPALALVSAGRRNPFGHPHAETLARLAGRGCRIARTDREGTLTVATDGQGLWLRAHEGPWSRLWSARSGPDGSR